MKKKKVLIHSNHCKAYTGFGKHTKNILLYLQKTGKYDLVEFSNGIKWGDPSLHLGLFWIYRQKVVEQNKLYDMDHIR